MTDSKDLDLERRLREAAMKSQMKQKAAAAERGDRDATNAEGGKKTGGTESVDRASFDEKLKKRAERFGTGTSPIKSPKTSPINKGKAGPPTDGVQNSSTARAAEEATTKGKESAANTSDAEGTADNVPPQQRKMSSASAKQESAANTSDAEGTAENVLPQKRKMSNASAKPPKAPRVELYKAGGGRWADQEVDDTEDMDHGTQTKGSKQRAAAAPKKSAGKSAQKLQGGKGVVVDSSDKAGPSPQLDTGASIGEVSGMDSDAFSRQSSAAPSTNGDVDMADDVPASETNKKVQAHLPSLHGCRTVEVYTKLNAIAEGTYGKVYRARCNTTGRIVALKQFKMGKDGAEGFPLTALREIDVLLKLKHESIVEVVEMVTGSDHDKLFMVMEFMEHDLKALMTDMKGHWSASEVKCLMTQLLEAMQYCHDNWVIHRDIKTSNLLFNNEGRLKVCDFGLARPYGDPIRGYTQLVVTLWYRSPELLLGCKEYAAEVDVWSLGCVFAELMLKQPIFMGKGEVDQVDRIFKVLGVPNEESWPGFTALPGGKKMRWQKSQGSGLRKLFPQQSYTGGPYLSDNGVDLLARMLELDPKQRIDCESALNHPYFTEAPQAKHPSMMPTFPSGNEGKKIRHRSPVQMFAHNVESPEVDLP